MVVRRELQRLPALRTLSTTDLEALRVSAPQVDFAQGAVLFRQGDAALGGFLVVSGRCRAELTADGRKTVLGHVGPGELVGESGLFRQGSRRTATVVAEEAVVALLLMPAILDQASARPALQELERRALASVAERVRHSTAAFQRLRPPPPDPSDRPDQLLGRLRRLWS